MWRSPVPRTGATGAGRQSKTVEKRSWLLPTFAMLLIPAALLLLTALIAGRPPAASEIERGVTISGVSVEGVNWQAAQSDLAARYETYLNEPLQLQIGDQTASVTPAQLGVSVNMDETLRRAQSVGRGNIVVSAGERIRAHTRGVDLAPVIDVDANQFYAALAQLSTAEIVAPTNAHYTWQSDQIAIVASTDGTGVDTDAARKALSEHVAGLASGPVVLPIVTLPPEISTADLTKSVQQARTLAGTPLYLSFDGTWWELEPADLVQLLAWNDGKVTFATPALTAALASLASSIDRDAVDASVVSVGDGTFTVVPEQDQRTLDIAASLADVQGAAGSKDRVAALAVERESPAITVARVTPLMERANAIITQGVAVGWPEGEQWLDPVGLAGAMRFDTINGVVSIDHAALAALIEPIANEINRPATGLRWHSGVLVTNEDSQPGRVVDLGASANAVASAALGGQAHVPLVINESIDPDQSASEIVIREMLGSSSTYYGSSSDNRRINVELAAAALDGALVAPGGSFSFNNAIGGTATLDDGYQMGFGIVVGTDGSARTVPSVAGGICQVATTTFQSAFWAGMPISVRNWHLYWIPNYGSGPGGMTGLDATVDPDYGLDFVFDNPTSDWLAIRAVADGEWLTVELWGTYQGWDVQVDPVDITNVVKADPTPRRQFSDQLEPGQEIVVEHAEDGFTATIHRQVLKDGQVISDTTLTSYYQPSHNVTLVGPGVSLDAPATTDETPAEEVPTEAPAVEETPVETEPIIEETPEVTEEAPPAGETP